MATGQDQPVASRFDPPRQETLERGSTGDKEDECEDDVLKSPLTVACAPLLNGSFLNTLANICRLGEINICICIYVVYAMVFDRAVQDRK